MIQRLVNPWAFLRGAWQVIRLALAKLPKMAAALPGAVWNGLAATPRRVGDSVQSLPQRIRANFYLRVQVMLGKEKAPEIVLIERLAHAMQQNLLAMDASHFDALHARLRAELDRRMTAP